MVTTGQILDALSDQPDAEVLWGTFDDRLDAAIGTLPTERALLVKALRGRPAQGAVVLWRLGDRPVYVRSCLPLRDGRVILYLDVGEQPIAAEESGYRFFIYPVAGGRIRISAALPPSAPWYGVIEVGAAATAPDGPLTVGQCVAWLDDLCRRGIPVEL